MSQNTIHEKVTTSTISLGIQQDIAGTLDISGYNISYSVNGKIRMQEHID